jgi:UDP-N-acetylmuramoyl-tripeptide--D-alanyl-D-alanine ligase
MLTAQKIIEVLNPSEYNINDTNSIIKGVTTDTRKECSGNLFLALKGINFDGHNFLSQAIKSGASLLCVNEEYAEHLKSAGFPFLAVKDTLKAYQTLAYYHRSKLKCKIIAITGSSGKTSTKEILSSILKKIYSTEEVYATEGNTNNHIGVPYNLLKLNSNHKAAVIELGSNHPGEIRALTEIVCPEIAVITSVGNAHIEFFKNLKGTADEKSDIFRPTVNYFGEKFIPAAAIPLNAPHFNILKQKTDAQVVTFGNNPDKCDITYEYIDGNIYGSTIKLSGSKYLPEPIITNWTLHGEHQASNAAAAVAAISFLKYPIPLQTVIEGLKNASLPGYRMKVFIENGVTWVNDAYNANPDSMMATLNWFSQTLKKDDKFNNKIIILGDMLEIGETSDEQHRKILSQTLSLFPDSNIITVGESFKNAKIQSVLTDETVVSLSTSEQCANLLKKLLNNNDIVFLKGSRGLKLEKCHQLIP